VIAARPRKLRVADVDPLEAMSVDPPALCTAQSTKFYT
jgi:hypothetical protein